MSYEAFREQCASICENAEYVRQYGDNEDSINWKDVCAKAIRALPLPEDMCKENERLNMLPLATNDNMVACLKDKERIIKENDLLCELLESAANGLRWYQDEHPEDVDDCDYEMLEQIDAALKGGVA